MSIFYLVIWLHFLADFCLQTDAMAKNKSTSLNWLTFHVVVYAIPFLLLGVKYALVNACAHWIVDFFTSRMTKGLWGAGRVRLFFVVIGFDQALHLTILYATLGLVVL